MGGGCTLRLRRSHCWRPRTTATALGPPAAGKALADVSSPHLTLPPRPQMNRGEMEEGELKERQARAMADPEVQAILSDPVMRQVGAVMGHRGGQEWVCSVVGGEVQARPCSQGGGALVARASPRHRPRPGLTHSIPPPPPLTPPPPPPHPQVLQDMQEDPSAAQQHLRHPDISRKIEKLVAAGILQVRSPACLLLRAAGLGWASAGGGGRGGVLQIGVPAPCACTPG